MVPFRTNRLCTATKPIKVPSTFISSGRTYMYYTVYFMFSALSPYAPQSLRAVLATTT